MSPAEAVETLRHLPADPFNSHALSSETQVAVWGTAIEALADRARE